MKKATFCNFRPRLQIFLPSNTQREIPDYAIEGQWQCKKCTIFCGEQKVAEVRHRLLPAALDSSQFFN
jgi:hypothetical protein